MTNHTVSAANATSAPRLSAVLAGQHQGADLNRADSLPQATIEPVNVTAPMNTPMTTSAWWMPSRSSRPPPAVAGFDLEVAVPADQHGGEADEAVEQRDQLGHAGHRHAGGPVQPDRRADHHAADQQPDLQGGRSRR